MSVQLTSVPDCLQVLTSGLPNLWAWRTKGGLGPNIGSLVSFLYLKRTGNPVCNKHWVVSFNSQCVSYWYFTAGYGLSTMKWWLTPNSCAGNGSLLKQLSWNSFGQWTSNYSWKSYLFYVFSSLVALEVLFRIQDDTLFKSVVLSLFCISDTCG